MHTYRWIFIKLYNVIKLHILFTYFTIFMKLRFHFIKYVPNIKLATNYIMCTRIIITWIVDNWYYYMYPPVLYATYSLHIILYYININNVKNKYAAAAAVYYIYRYNTVYILYLRHCASFELKKKQVEYQFIKIPLFCYHFSSVY